MSAPTVKNPAQKRPPKARRKLYGRICRVWADAQGECGYKLFIQLFAHSAPRLGRTGLNALEVWWHKDCKLQAHAFNGLVLLKASHGKWFHAHCVQPNRAESAGRLSVARLLVTHCGGVFCQPVRQVNPLFWTVWPAHNAGRRKSSETFLK